VDVTKNEEGFMWDRVPLNAKRKSSVSLIQVSSFKENDDLMVAVTRSPRWRWRRPRLAIETHDGKACVVARE
jgi:hypothetical protein